MTSPHCPSKKTVVPEVVGTLTLVITRSRELVSLGHPVTLGSLSPLIFLDLSAILGIEFPWSLHLADLWRRVSAPFLSFPAKLIFCLIRRRIFLGEAPALTC